MGPRLTTKPHQLGLVVISMTVSGQRQNVLGKNAFSNLYRDTKYAPPISIFTPGPQVVAGDQVDAVGSLPSPGPQPQPLCSAAGTSSVGLNPPASQLACLFW